MIKSITCRVGAADRVSAADRVGVTEWKLVRLDRNEFNRISKQRIVGHPVYWSPWVKFHSDLQLVDGEYEVWPLPAVGVEVTPHYED